MLPNLPLPRIFGPVHCDAPEPVSSLKQTIKSAVTVRETELGRWRRTFDANAKTEVEGQKFIDPESFTNAIAPQGDLKITRAQWAILFRVADKSKRGLLSWDDFLVFETSLKRPDADYWVAFQFFDVNEDGTISFDELKDVFATNVGEDTIPFNFDCDWIQLYLGKKNGRHVLGYHEFTQVMKGLQGERLRQAFRFFDKDGDGYIRAEEFKRVIMEIAGHKLSDTVIERLPTLTTISPGGRISYSEVVAFYTVMKEMDMIERVIRDATSKTKDGRIDQADFLEYSQSSTRYSLFTPMEASIIFHFAGRGNGAQRLAMPDFAQLLDPRWTPPADEHLVTGSAPAAATNWASEVGHGLWNFGIGGIAGAFGATFVYPIDLVKTRMQNQRSSVVGQLLYENSMDCVRKVFRNEGFLGFYRGLGPQLVGVAPEKAIKLVVNDLVRSRAMDPETGRITVPWEMIAGGTAGGCQVVFTNPLEIVKIRLQVQGEAARMEGAAPRGAIHIVRSLGLLGLYRGASACLLRDIPFSAIYFPSYAHLKKDVFQEGHHGKQLSFYETLSAAAIAGMPAAYLTTPADVVKTRLQVEARKGQANYKGLSDAFVKIYREEGFKAFFKGGPARILRSSPQFGFTLMAYEYLHKFMPFPWAEPHGAHAASSPLSSQPEDISRVRARNALKILLDVSTSFGKHEQFAAAASAYAKSRSSSSGSPPA